MRSINKRPEDQVYEKKFDEKEGKNDVKVEVQSG